MSSEAEDQISKIETALNDALYQAVLKREFECGAVEIANVTEKSIVLSFDSWDENNDGTGIGIRAYGLVAKVMRDQFKKDLEIFDVDVNFCALMY